MGLQSGSLSYTVFYPQGRLEDKDKLALLKQLQRNLFKPLVPEDDFEVSYGWTALGDPLTLELEFETVFQQHYMNLSMRVDKYALPSNLVAAHLARAEEDFMEQQGTKKISKSQREDLKSMVTTELKARTFPRMAMYDMSWDLTKDRIRFFSQSKQALTMFTELMVDTFGLDLLPAMPFTMADLLLPSDDEKKMLNSLTSTQFAEGVPGVDF